MNALASTDAHGGVTSRWWGSRAATKTLLVAGIVAAGLYVFGDVVSGLVYKGSRPYSFKDQWISELTAYGSPVRPLMVTVITVHDLLTVLFLVGIWRAAQHLSHPGDVGPAELTAGLSASRAAVAKPPQLAYRPSADFESALATTSSISPGTSGREALTRGGFSPRCA